MITTTKIIGALHFPSSDEVFTSECSSTNEFNECFIFHLDTV